MKEKATRQSCDVVLPVDYRQPHPVMEILVGEKKGDDTVVCHLAMLSAPNVSQGAADGGVRWARSSVIGDCG